jgi:hypothetical protein
MKASAIVAKLAVLVTVSACETSVSLPPVVPTFHDVASTANGIRTGYRPADDGASWQFFTHDDELDESWCADLAVAPDGRMRHLAFLHRTSQNDWLLSVRTGLGPDNWSTTFSGVEVPPLENVSCQPVRIAHLTDDRYAIIWTADAELHHALYDSSASPPADLVLGEPVSVPSLEGVSADRTALTWWNDEVQLVWSAAQGTRIQTMRGELTDEGITFGPSSTFTNVSHDAMSDVIVHAGAMHVAVKQDDRITLLGTTTGGTGWEEVASCPATVEMRGKLIFTDPGGVMWVAEGGSAGSHLRNLVSCETRAFPLPIVSGRLQYHPGA